LMSEVGAQLDEGDAKRAEEMRSEGATVMFLAVDARVVALLAVADRIKDGAAEAIRALHQEGLEVLMLTGDNATTARAVADVLDIDEVRADVSPADKAEAVKELKASGKRVA